MPTARLYSMNGAAEELGVDRNLVTFLVTDRQIPYSTGGPSAGRGQGRAKFLTPEALEALRSAVADYRQKATSAVSA